MRALKLFEEAGRFVKHLILGGEGQLGRTFGRRLGDDAVALGRARTDLTRPEMLAAALDAAKPDVVLNCAAYNAGSHAPPRALRSPNIWTGVA